MAKLRNPALTTYELVDKLEKTSKSRWRVRRRVELIEQIAACDEALILPQLVGTLFERLAVFRAAIQAVNELVGGVPANQPQNRRD